MDLVFRNINENDKQQIDNLLQSCFPNSNPNRAVVKLRQGKQPIPEYSMVAENNGQIVANISFHYVKLPSGKKVPILGQVAVRNDYRGKGLGNAMVEYGLNNLAGLEDGVLIVGTTDYYEEYGFEDDCVKNLALDGDITPFVFMGLEFNEGVFATEKGKITK